MTEKNFTLRQNFMKSSREKLLYTSLMLGYRMTRNLRKETIASRLAEAILANPLHLLKRIPFQDVLKLQKMVNAPGHAIPDVSGLLYDTLTQTGIAETVETEEQAQEIIPSDLAIAFKPVIDRYVESTDPDKGIIKYERIITGLLNLYGMLNYPAMLEYCQKADPEISAQMLNKICDESWYFQNNLHYPGEEILFVSPFVYELHKLIDEIKSRESIKPKIFSPEEILAAGDTQFPLPPENEQIAAFKRHLGKLMTGKDVKDSDAEIVINQRISKVWMLQNNENTPLQLLEEITEGFNLDMKNINQFINLVMDMGNNLPQWILKGNTSRSVFEQHERDSFFRKPPTLVMGPNARNAGINITQEEFNHMWEENVKHPSAKVGRNDPCPCGSGKKFKHCCLNKMN